LAGARLRRISEKWLDSGFAITEAKIWYDPTTLPQLLWFMPLPGHKAEPLGTTVAVLCSPDALSDIQPTTSKHSIKQND